jgi:hypothetical protein
MIKVMFMLVCALSLAGCGSFWKTADHGVLKNTDIRIRSVDGSFSLEPGQGFSTPFYINQSLENLMFSSDHPTCVESGMVTRELGAYLRRGAKKITVEFVNGDPPLHGAIVFCYVHTQVPLQQYNLYIPDEFIYRARQGELVSVYEIAGTAYSFTEYGWIVWLSKNPDFENDIQIGGSVASMESGTNRTTTNNQDIFTQSATAAVLGYELGSGTISPVEAASRLYQMEPGANYLPNAAGNTRTSTSLQDRGGIGQRTVENYAYGDQYAISQGDSASAMAPIVGGTEPETGVAGSGSAIDGRHSQFGGSTAGSSQYNCEQEERQLKQYMEQAAQRAKNLDNLCQAAKLKYDLNMKSVTFLRRCPMQDPSGDTAQQLEAEAREDMKTIRDVCEG